MVKAMGTLFYKGREGKEKGGNEGKGKEGKGKGESLEARREEVEGVRG